MPRFSLLVVLCGCLAIPIPALAQMEVQVVPAVRSGEAPPPNKQEDAVQCPSPAHVFVEGHWVWRDSSYKWLPGQWTIPPGSSCTWTAAKYKKKGKNWAFYEGHWVDASSPAKDAKDEPETETVKVDQAPPTPIVEVVAKAPFPNALWAKGHWYWSGVSWQWAGGHWEQRHADYAWDDAKWVRRGDHNWVFSPSHWRHLTK